jgi:solute carrier family 45 protein 1/2/4
MSQVKDLTIVIAVASFYILDFSINVVQACCRSLIVDMTPLWQQNAANAWAGRMLGLGNLLGYFMGYIDLPMYFEFLGPSQMKILCVLASTVIFLCLGLTCMTVREVPMNQPVIENQKASFFEPFFTIWKTIKQLPSPIQAICNAQFFNWAGWFPFLFYG